MQRCSMTSSMQSEALTAAPVGPGSVAGLSSLGGFCFAGSVLVLASSICSNAPGMNPLESVSSPSLSGNTAVIFTEKIPCDLQRCRFKSTDLCGPVVRPFIMVQCGLMELLTSTSQEATGRPQGSPPEAKDPLPMVPPLPQHHYPRARLQHKCGPLGPSGSKLLTAVLQKQAFVWTESIATP